MRPAGPDDDAGVADLLVAVFRDHYARRIPPVEPGADRIDELRRTSERRARGTVLVAEREGLLLGTVSLLPPGAPGSEAWRPAAANLRLLGVAVAHQGRGVSGLLMDEAERRAAADGARSVCLHVRRGTPAVEALYLERGYRRDPAGDIDALPAVWLEAYALTLPAGAELDEPDRAR